MPKNILLIGQGPLPGPEIHKLGFPQLRTDHFRAALTATGHPIRLLLLGQRSSPLPPPDAPWSGRFDIKEEGADWIDRARTLAADADVIVSAGPYNPGRVAALIAGDRPLWGDIPGDPFSELEAVARVSTLSAERRAAALAAALPLLYRADAFSTISTPQLHAAMGQLGVLGRVDPPTPRVCTIPIANHLPHDPAPPRARAPGSPLCVALSGAFNPWFDVETLVSGLDGALSALPDLRVLCTGGPVSGLPDDGWRRFKRWATVHRGRVTLAGWVPQRTLPLALAPAHVGLSLDRAGSEPVLGSRTRVLLFTRLGMGTIATDRTEIVREASDHLRAIPAGDPAELTAALVAEHVEGRSEAAILQTRAVLTERYDPQRIAAPLLEFVARPQRAAASPQNAETLAAEVTRLRQELAALHGSPTWKTLSTAHRALRRLTRRPDST